MNKRLAPILNFREDKEKEDKKEYYGQYSYADNYLSIYLKQYKIQVLVINYNKNNKKEEQENRNKKNRLESIIDNILKDLEGKKEQNSTNNNLENLISDSRPSIEKYPPNKHQSVPEINQIKPNKIQKIRYIKDYPKTYNGTHVNEKSGARVFYVPSSDLPRNVLGMYVPAEHTIYISQDLSPKTQEFVYKHEEWHSIYGAGEDEADDYAERETGYRWAC